MSKERNYETDKRLYSNREKYGKFKEENETQEIKNENNPFMRYVKPIKCSSGMRFGYWTRR